MPKKQNNSHSGEPRKKGLGDYISRTYYRFLAIRGEPRDVALGFALGVFVGMSPYLGVQAVTAVFFAAVFKWNKISAAVGVFISNPFTVPLIYPFTYWVGSFFYEAQEKYVLPEDLNFQTIVVLIHKAPHILVTLTIGGVVVGLPLAVAAYLLSHSAILEYRREIKQKLAERKARLAKQKDRIIKKVGETAKASEQKLAQGGKKVIQKAAEKRKKRKRKRKK